MLASLLPASVTMQEFEHLLGLEPRKEVKLYKTPPSSTRIKKVQDYCEKVWGKRAPIVLDAFAGRGSIPFEAARYGLNVLASDLNPVAVVTMKAAMEYPLKFGADLQQDIDKWVKWVGDEAEKRLVEFFPCLPGEKTLHYLWAHTVVCPSCESVVPLSPNWWLYRRTEKQNLHRWCAVKPILNPENKCVDFELVKGSKGKGTTILTSDGEYKPDKNTTISRGVGKCPNCSSVIEEETIKAYARSSGLGHILYAVAYRKGSGSLEFRIPSAIDYEGVKKAEKFVISKINYWELSGFLPIQEIPENTHRSVFPELFFNELTDKDREAIVNPGRFRNMGVSPEELANQDYEAKMAMAFAEYHRVLRDDGVMTVQFNHKDSGAWDVLAKSLIDAGFEITASWAVSTENPQNLHQAQKNAVSSTVLLVCRKRAQSGRTSLVGRCTSLRLEILYLKRRQK